MSRPLASCMVVGASLLLVSCSDTPTQTVSDAIDDASASVVPGIGNGVPLQTPIFHTARVDQNGNLIDGTAVAVTHLDNGKYLVEFDASIGECAGTAQNALFPGANASINDLTTQILIGYGPGLQQDDHLVSVNHFHTENNDFNRNSSFTLILVCPRT